MSEDPDDYYEEYNEWLMDRARDLYICNGDDLIRHFEAGTQFEEFLEERKNGIRATRHER